MSHSLNRYFSLSAFFLTFVVSAFAQDPVSRSNRENSPYSRYGLGEERNGINMALIGIGSVSSAYSNAYLANTDNPASYARIKLTTYEAGGEGRRKTILAANGDKYKTGMATLSYFNITLPVGKYAGLNFGLRPEKRLYYWADDSSNIPGFGNGVISDRADGSLNYGHIGIAGKYKGLSVGANFGYLFGTYDQLSYLISTDNTANVYNSLFNRSAKIGGIYWSTGALYDIDLKKDRIIRLGATAALTQELNSTRNETWINYSNTTGYADSSFTRSAAQGKVVLPMSLGFGLQYLKGDKLLLALDFKTAQWSEFTNHGFKDSLTDTYRIGVGCEYTPDILSLHQYFRRVTYRIGFYYGKDKVFLNNTAINYMAVTTGLSLPFKRTLDRIHLSAELGRRGTVANGLLQENFVRFGVGISLNDRWFIKRKYE